MGQITNNEFLTSVLYAEAWKKVSDESLSMEMIDKFQDKLDWETLSQNRNILWTATGIAKFAGKINWSDFRSAAMRTSLRMRILTSSRKNGTGKTFRLAMKSITIGNYLTSLSI